MPIIKINKTENYTLILWKIEEDITDLLKQLNPEEKALIEINRFQNTNRKKSSEEDRVAKHYTSH